MRAGGRSYYCPLHPTFLIEFDNSRNSADHIHSVWRDFEEDLGERLLAGHYRSGLHRQ